MRRLLFICCVLMMCSAANSAKADLEVIQVLSLEWLVDSSDAILVAALGDLDKEPKPENLDALKAPKGISPLPWPWQRPRRFGAGVPLDAKVMLFGRSTKDGGIGIHYAIFLTEGDAPAARDKRINYFWYSLPLVPGPNEHIPNTNICFIFDVQGNPITRPADVLERVKNRLRFPSRVPPDCQRDLVEREIENYGGFHLFRKTPLDHPDWIFSICVPPEPEFRAELLLQIGSDCAGTRWTAASKLANYPDGKVEDALVALLNDEFVIRHSGRYLVREAAAESLKRIRTKMTPAK